MHGTRMQRERSKVVLPASYVYRQVKNYVTIGKVQSALKRLTGFGRFALCEAYGLCGTVWYEVHLCGIHTVESTLWICTVDLSYGLHTHAKIGYSEIATPRNVRRKHSCRKSLSRTLIQTAFRTVTD